MIIKTIEDVTPAVLAEVARARDPRVREILSIAVKHLHAFAREAKLTEEEFQLACAFVVRAGQLTNTSHNEVVLACGSLGLSSIVCLMNNGNNGTTETTANLLGPFWRVGAPRYENGASLVQSDTSGVPLFVSAQVRRHDGSPVAGADVDVWHTSGEGFYENQDPAQADMNLRGMFTTDQDGRFWFRTVRPAGYPIPVNGPVGDLARTLGRHNMRPAHLHFMITKPGLKTHISQVYFSDDPNLETDVQFGVTQALIADVKLHETEPAPSPDIKGPWYSLDYTFRVDEGEMKLPRPPITGKADGELPKMEVLAREPR